MNLKWNVLLVVMFVDIMQSEGGKVLSVVRQLQADMYTITDDIGNENAVGEGCDCIRGTKEEDSNPVGGCQCQCPSSKPIFREDKGTCVKKLSDCSHDLSSLSDASPHFLIAGDTTFVTIGKDIPHLDINIDEEELVLPFCVITKGQYLTTSGWQDMEGSSFDVPIQMTSYSEKIQFEWVGNSSSTNLVEGRLVLVHLLCKNAASLSQTSFMQCIPFRVQGRVDMDENILSLVDEEGKSEAWLSGGMISAIGILLFSLTLTYVLLSLFYFRGKRRKEKNGDTISERSHDLEKGKKVIEPSFSTDPITLLSNDPHNPLFLFRPPIQIMDQEENLQLHLNSKHLMSKKQNFSSRKTEEEFYSSPSTEEEIYSMLSNGEEEIYSVPSPEEEIEGRRQREQRRMAEIQRGCCEDTQSEDIRSFQNDDIDDYTTYECASSVIGASIVETSSNSDLPPSHGRSEANGKSVDGVRPRRKLFFNPSYFEPELLHEPPPGAIDFLSSVRAMMSVAKTKMQMKSFQPTLIDIPEAYGFARKGKSRNQKETSYVSKGKLNNVKEPLEESIHDCKSDMQDYRELNRYRLSLKELLPKSEKEMKNRVTLGSDNQSIEEEEENFENNTKNLVEEIQNLEAKIQKLNETCDTSKSHPLDETIETLERNLNKTRLANKSRPNSFRMPSQPIPVKRNLSLRENVETMKQGIKSKLNRVSSLSFKRKKTQRELERYTNNCPDSHDRESKVNNWLNSLGPQSESKDAMLVLAPVSGNKRDFVFESNIKTKENNNWSTNSNATNDRTNLNGSSSGENGISSIDLRLENNHETFTCQEDKEIYTINVNASFAEKESSNNTSFSDKSQSFYSTNEGSSSGNYSVNRGVTMSLNRPYVEENSYEDIHFKTHKRQLKDNLDNHNASYNSIYSDVLSDDSENSLSSNLLCIELGDNVTKNSNGKGSNPPSRRSNSIKRNDSIAQDSLERPKIKKKWNYEDINIKERNLDTFYSKQNTDKPTPVKRSKTMKTFKDYKHIKFSNSKSPITFLGEGINLNYSKSKPNRENQSSPKAVYREKMNLPDDNSLPRRKLRYSTSFSPFEIGRRSKQISNVYSDNYSYNSEKELDNSRDDSFSRRFKSHVNIYDLVCNKTVSRENSTKKVKPTPRSLKLAFIDENHLHNLHIPGQDHGMQKTSLKVEKIRDERGNESRENIILMNGNKHQLNNFYSREDINGTAVETLNWSFGEKVKEELERYLHQGGDIHKGSDSDVNTKYEDNNLLERYALQKDNVYKILRSSSVKSANPPDLYKEIENAKPVLKKSNSISHKDSFKKKTSNLIQRSLSLHQKAQGHGISKLDSTGRKSDRSKFSVYINDSFSVDT